MSNIDMIIALSVSFSFILFLYIGWYCGAGVFGLIWFKIVLSRLALPTFFNNNNNNNNIYIVHALLFYQVLIS